MSLSAPGSQGYEKATGWGPGEGSHYLTGSPWLVTGAWEAMAFCCQPRGEGSHLRGFQAKPRRALEYSLRLGSVQQLQGLRRTVLLSGSTEQSLPLLLVAKWTFHVFSIPRTPRRQEVEPRTQGSPRCLSGRATRARLCLSRNSGF